MLLDLSTRKGQDVLHRLMAEVDVITLNATDEQRDRLGLTPEKLEQIDPGLILVQLDAYGGPLRGPKSNHPGYDDLVQAATGVMVRFGGGMETPEEHAHVGTIDVLAGLCGCVALGGALLRLKHTGKGGIARSSLAAAGNLIQAQFMYDFDGRPPFDEPSGRESLGWGPFYHCYEASDAWFFFAAPTERFAAIARVPELADLVNVPEEELRGELAKRFRELPVHHWRDAFGGDSAAVPLSTLEETRKASLQRESEHELDISGATFRVVRHDQHPMGRWVDLVAPNAVRSKNGKVTMPDPMPKYGQDTVSVLSRLGYSEAQVTAMLEDNVVSQGWSEKFLPE
jgi:crotonobetainyl-CoA:carnitine CoA-transferase CaiB-like acyl-CoA transferase